MVRLRVICFLLQQRNLFGSDHSGNFKMYAIISEGYHKQPMITSYLSWLQRGLCVAKMISWKHGTSWIQTDKEWHQSIKKGIPISENNLKSICDWKSLRVPFLTKCQHFLEVIKKDRKDRDDHGKRKKNQDRHKELWALKVPKGETPGRPQSEMPQRNCPDLCAGFRS